MLKQVLALSITAALLSGCTATQKPTPPSLTNAELNSSLLTSQTVVIDAINARCSQQSDEINALSNEMRKLKTQVSTAMAERPKTIVVPPPPVARPIAIPDQCSEATIGERD